MLQKHTEFKTSFNITEFLFWCILLGFLPLVSGVITALQFLKLAIYFSGVFIVGEIALSKLDTLKLLPFLLKTGVNILVGAIITSFVSFIINPVIIIYLLFALFIFYVVKYCTISLKPVSKSFIAFLPLLFLFLHAEETMYATSKDFTVFIRDYYYYNAIAESLYQNFNVHDSFYSKGLSINYPTLPFQPIAQMAQFTGIKTSVLTWGVFGKLVAITSFIPVAYFTNLFAYFLKNKNITVYKFNYKYFFFASLFLLFLAPVHFLNLVKLKFASLTLPGFGYVLPLGSLGFSIAIFLTGMACICIFLNNKTQDYIYAFLFISFIAASKMAALLPVGIFFGVIALFRLLKKDYRLLISLFATLPLIYVFNKLFSNGNADYFKLILSHNSPWVQYAKQQAAKNGIGGTVIKQVVIVLLLNIIFWIGYKVFAMLLMKRSIQNENKKQTVQIIIACLISVIFSFIPGFIFNMGFYDEGKILWDNNIDLMQFVRAAIVLLTIFSVAAVIYIIAYNHSKKYTASILTLCIVWCVLNSSFVIHQVTEKPTLQSTTWYNEVQKEFNDNKPKLMAINGTENYSGVCLSSYGIGPWYCTGTTATGDGYSLTSESYKRAKHFSTLFNTTDINLQKEMSELKNKKVDCIVFTPADSIYKSKLIQQNFIEPFANSKWFCKIK